MDLHPADPRSAAHPSHVFRDRDRPLPAAGPQGESPRPAASLPGTASRSPAGSANDGTNPRKGLPSRRPAALYRPEPVDVHAIRDRKCPVRIPAAFPDCRLPVVLRDGPDAFILPEPAALELQPPAVFGFGLPGRPRVGQLPIKAEGQVVLHQDRWQLRAPHRGTKPCACTRSAGDRASALATSAIKALRDAD